MNGLTLKSIDAPTTENENRKRPPDLILSTMVPQKQNPMGETGDSPSKKTHSSSKKKHTAKPQVRKILIVVENEKRKRVVVIQYPSLKCWIQKKRNLSQTLLQPDEWPNTQVN
jgi:hypothetical protein